MFCHPGGARDPSAADPADRPEARLQTKSSPERLQRLIERRWQHWMREFPEFATLVGDRRYDDRWTDLSSQAIEGRRKADRAFRAELGEIDPSALSPKARLDYELLRFELDDQIEGARYAASQRFPGAHDFSNLYAPITPMGGVQQNVLRFLSMMPTEQASDYDKVLARLRGVPRLIDQTIALMKIGLKKGMSPPRITLRDVGDQIGAYVVDDPMQSPLLRAFQEFPEQVPPADRRRLKAEAGRVFEAEVRPAFRRLHEFFVGEYLPATGETIAARDMPNGAAIYAYNVRHFTTTRLEPSEVHEIGLAEVERIRASMQRLIRSLGFDGSIAAFGEQLERDPEQFYTDAEDLLSRYRELAKRADSMLPRLFNTLPRLPYGVTKMPTQYEKTFAGAYYQPGSPSAERAAEFVVNTYDLGSRPRWEMEALLLHEAVPGHHMQFAIAQQLDGMPMFRRYYWPVAFGEGWAMYAETLGYEMGLYTDPLSKFGQLSSEMWRAVRLAVDTGIHSQGWTRVQAIEFLRRNTGKSEHDSAVEVDRYIVWPGHALAYKVGQLEIQALREHAQKSLGEAFDVREFHHRVLANGAIPLSILRSQVQEWVDARTPKSPNGARSSRGDG